MAKAKNKNKKMRVIELQSYINGIVDISGEDWYPNKEQWNSILLLIQNIKPEPVVEVVREVSNTNSPQYQSRQQPQQPQQNIIQQSSVLDSEKFEPINERSNRTDMRTIKERQGNPMVAAGGKVASSGMTIITPNKEAGDTKSDFR